MLICWESVPWIKRGWVEGTGANAAKLEMTTRVVSLSLVGGEECDIETKTGHLQPLSYHLQ